MIDHFSRVCNASRVHAGPRNHSWHTIAGVSDSLLRRVRSGAFVVAGMSWVRVTCSHVLCLSRITQRYNP
jgi:hypothetical protein